eukprot:3933674-Rhodomonas_salina.1
MVREGRPCKLYFDIEWTVPLSHQLSAMPASGDMSIAVIKQIISDVLTERFPARRHDTVLELNGSRVVAKRGNDDVEEQAWKNSFHLIYPDLVFRCNNGLMKQIAKQVHAKVGSLCGLTSDHCQGNPVDLA